MQDNQLIFIISQPRSGSTLTQRIIGSHPRVYTRSEPWVLLHSLYSLKQKGFQAEFDTDIWRPAFNDFIDHLPHGARRGYVKSLRRMHLNLYANYLTSTGKQIFLDKTPRYYFIIDELYEVFPNAKFILLLRNPLAVLYSILKTWIGDDFPLLARHRHDLITAIEKEVEFALADQQNKCVVRYEDLLADPTVTVQKICDYAELENSDDMIRSYFSDNISDWKYGDPVHARSKKGIDPSSEKKWLEGLVEPQVWRFFYDYLQLIGQENFEKLGYSYNETISLLLANMPLNDKDEIIRTTQGLQNYLRVNSEDLKRYDFPQKYSLLFNQIQEIKNSGINCVVYGNGSVGKTIRALMPERIVGFVDRANPIHAPKNLKKMNFDKIIISVLGREKEIINYLINELKIPRNKILTLDVGV